MRKDMTAILEFPLNPFRTGRRTGFPAHPTGFPAIV
jgi:hypothetical protein